MTSLKIRGIGERKFMAKTLYGYLTMKELKVAKKIRPQASRYTSILPPSSSPIPPCNPSNSDDAPAPIRKGLKKKATSSKA
jgi:hypothetical protein